MRRAASPTLILIASGSEVGLIVAAAERLRGEGIAVRCVSMPSWELFDALPQADRDAVLPPRSPRGSPSSRRARRAGIATSAIAATCSASSASARRRRREMLLREYGFTVDNVVRARQGAAR